LGGIDEEVLGGALKPEGREACGVMAISLERGNVSPMIYYGLMALQHRGQESCGISVYDGRALRTVRRYGLVGEELQRTAKALGGRAGIGHVRYSTLGESSLLNAQPIPIRMGGETFSIAHNGTIVNYEQLRDGLRERGVGLKTESDSEVILRLFLDSYRGSCDAFGSLEACSEKIEGGYSIVMASSRGELIAARDPLGLRPLCMGNSGNSIAMASESVALDINSLSLLGDIEPGTAVFVGKDGVEVRRFADCPRRAHCMFEYVYFSRPDSILEGRSVYDVRLNLGRNLAGSIDGDVDSIVPVPDTSRTAAEGLSRVTGIPVAEGLMKNRYVHRTFIMPTPEAREGAVRMKLNPLKSVLKGKKVVLVDDSIVRGTTLKNIVGMVKSSGAKEIHVRITCPPIISPCFYGIDISSRSELIAANNSVEEIRRIIGADSLVYQSLEGLVDAIGLPRGDLCNACLTGEYPTPLAQERSEGAEAIKGAKALAAHPKGR
jgi:amidophosphoribosyltransferase